MKVLLIGEDINKAHGGIASVIRMILESEYLQDHVSYTTVFSTSQNGNKYLRGVGWLACLLKAFYLISKNDVVHVHYASNLNFYLSSLIIIFVKIFKKKSVFHNHAADFKDFYLSQSEIGKIFVRYIFSIASLNVTLSKSWLLWYQQIAPRSKWETLYNAPQVGLQGKKIRCRDNFINILYLNRIERRKGVYDLVNVIPEIIKTFPNVKFTLAGDGDIDGVTAVIERENMKEYASVPGWQNKSQKEELLSKADIFILPSYNEGLPISLLEAMAYGVAPIVTKVGGIPEVVNNGSNGLLIEPGDVDGLKRALYVLIKNEALRQNISNNAFNAIKDNYSEMAFSQNLLSLYEAVL